MTPITQIGIAGFSGYSAPAGANSVTATPAAAPVAARPAPETTAIQAKTSTPAAAEPAAVAEITSVPTIPRAPLITLNPSATGSRMNESRRSEGEVRNKAVNGYRMAQADNRLSDGVDARSPMEPGQSAQRRPEEEAKARWTLADPETEQATPSDRMAAARQEALDRKAAQKKEAEEEREADQDEPLGKAVSQMNTMVHSFGRNVGFKVTQDAGDVYVEVVDKTTDRVIRRLPPEDLLSRLDRIKNDLGYMVDEKR